MLSRIKSFTSKAIYPISSKFSSKIKLSHPQDPQLQQKLQQLSNQLLNSSPSQQFKLYQQYTSDKQTNFNVILQKIYYDEQNSNTDVMACILRFYTFLLTNSKSELVVCKLVSQRFVVGLTKIDVATGEKGGSIQPLQQQEEEQLDRLIDKQQQYKVLNNVLFMPQTQFSSLSQQQQQDKHLSQQQTHTLSPCYPPSPSYTHSIDFQQLNSYKVALIRSYINCITPQSINYMILQEQQLPIFTNCISGYKYFLSDGVEGTCLSNCILMIINKVNLNQEVCGIVFGGGGKEGKIENDGKDKRENDGKDKRMMKKGVKLDGFLKEVMNSISIEIVKLLTILEEYFTKLQLKLPNKQQITQKYSLQHQNTFLNLLLHSPSSQLQNSLQFIQSNILFCIDLINSINNYNYTSLIKQSLRRSIEQKLIKKIVKFVENGKSNQRNLIQRNRFHLVVIKLIKIVFNLSIVCQKQEKLVRFLNDNVVGILKNIIDMNQIVFCNRVQHTICTNQMKLSSQQQPSLLLSNKFTRLTLSYLCSFTYILLTLTLSPSSKLASRKKLQISQQTQQLKQQILENVFRLLEQINQCQQDGGIMEGQGNESNERSQISKRREKSQMKVVLREKVCYKAIKNVMLTVFYLTIREDRQNKQILIIKTPSSDHLPPNLGLYLSFKYNILLLHGHLSSQFSHYLKSHLYWQYIVNNYQSLMREIPSTILSIQQSDKYCHYHNDFVQNQQQKLRNVIMKCQAMRNYRYMIIHETRLDDRVIRLENVYHKHFISPGWGYQPGQVVNIDRVDNGDDGESDKIICEGQILQDFQCLLIVHRISSIPSTDQTIPSFSSYKIIANIRYKKIHSFIPQQKSIIRMKLIGIQELVLQFDNFKQLVKFKDYLNENRNKTREKQLKFINYYLNMYKGDSDKIINQIYQEDIFYLNLQKCQKEIIQINDFQGIQNDHIPEIYTKQYQEKLSNYQIQKNYKIDQIDKTDQIDKNGKQIQQISQQKQQNINKKQNIIKSKLKNGLLAIKNLRKNNSNKSNSNKSDEKIENKVENQENNSKNEQEKQKDMIQGEIQVKLIIEDANISEIQQNQEAI